MQLSSVPKKAFAAEAIYLKADSSVVAASSKADTTSYTALQKKAHDERQKKTIFASS
jgi:hypothetical protein